MNQALQHCQFPPDKNSTIFSRIYQWGLTHMKQNQKEKKNDLEKTQRLLYKFTRLPARLTCTSTTPFDNNPFFFFRFPIFLGRRNQDQVLPFPHQCRVCRTYSPSMSLQSLSGPLLSLSSIYTSYMNIWTRDDLPHVQIRTRLKKPLAKLTNEQQLLPCPMIVHTKTPATSRMTVN